MKTLRYTIKDIERTKVKKISKINNILLFDIARCKELENPESICKEIIELQRNKKEWQIPEPWSGKLNLAPILFICLNPSITENQFYPLKDSNEWPDDKIEDYFTNLFAEDERWVKDGLKPKLRNGESDKWVRNWASIRSWYCQITGKKKGDVHIGIDYAISDIVHCKSVSGKGVNDEVIRNCTSLYLKRLLDTAIAKIIIILGADARKIITKIFEIQDNSLFKLMSFKIGRSNKYFLFMHHTNYRGIRSPNNVLSRKELERLKGQIKEILN